MRLSDRWPLCLGEGMLRRRDVITGLPRRGGAYLDGALGWLLAAKRHGLKGGVPAFYDVLRNRWSPPYPETTGYTIETLLACASMQQQPKLRKTALELADYLMAVRTSEGGVAHWQQTDAASASPVVFDTGQVIFGWLAAWRESGNAEYLEAAKTAGAWLLDVQDPCGAWIRYQHKDTVKVIDTRVAWALLKLAEATRDEAYAHAAQRTLDWALQQQQPNGWFRKASFIPGEDPFTHTIAYTVEGLLESGLCLNEQRYIEAAEQAGRVLVGLQRSDGALASTYNQSWRASSRSSCLTGNCQMALIWLRLYKLSGDRAYLSAARRTVAFVASTQDLETSNPNVRGGIAGSWPIYGRYARFQYPNWAAKFFVDALLALEGVNGANYYEEGSGCGTGRPCESS